MSKNPFPQDGFQHYYLHDDHSQPLAVVAIGPGTVEGTVVRGISIRSELDAWNKVKGRKKAVGRCRKALACRCTSESVAGYRFATDSFLRLYQQDFTVRIMDSVSGTPADRVVKSAFNVKPTEKEAKILECLKKRMVAPTVESPAAAPATA